MVIRVGTKFRDTMLGTDSSENFLAGAGDDTVYAGGGDDRVFGGDGNDTLFGEAGNDFIHGDAGDDVIDGGTGANQLFGDLGNDRFMLQSGSNAVDGGEGTDTVDYSLQGQQYRMGQPTGNGVLVDLRNGTGGLGASGDTYVGIENVVGSAFNDTIIENGSANIINAGAGNDTVMSAGGLADSFDGGDGVDWIDFSLVPEASRSPGGVHASLESGLTGSMNYSFLRYSTLTNFENMRGSSFNDSLTGNAGVNRIESGTGDDNLAGLGGGDALDGGDGFDTAHYVSSTSAVTVNLATGVGNGGDATGDTLANIEAVVGSAYDDRLTGNGAANTLDGSTGNDILDGGAGNDTLAGGEGFDVADYSLRTLDSPTGVNVDLARGTAVIAGTAYETDRLSSIEGVSGTQGNDMLFGNASDNTLMGNDGIDTITGGLGADKLDGGAGIDTLNYASSQAGVRVNLETGAAAGGEAQGDAIANFENLFGSTTAANDLTGSSADNRITGGSAGDTIDGGKGNDTITGGLGADKLTGGEGSDSFIFNLVSTGSPVSTDDVTDFQIGADQITFGISSAFDGKVMMDEVNGGTLVWYEQENGVRSDGVMLWGVSEHDLEQNFDSAFELVPGRERAVFTTEGQIGYDWNFG